MTTRKSFFIMPLHRYQSNKNRQHLIANKKKYIEQNNKNNSRNIYSPSYSYTTFGPNYVYIPNDNNENQEKQNPQKQNPQKPNPKKSNNLWILIASVVGVYLSTKKNK